MKRFTAMASVAALFATGVLVGALGVHLYYSSQLRRPGGPPQMASRLLAGHLHRQLHLTPEQQQQVDAILERSWRASQRLRREVAPRAQQLMERTHEEIAAVLTPEQRLRFEEMRRRQRGPVERLLLGPPAGGPPGPPGRGPHRRHPVEPPIEPPG